MYDTAPADRRRTSGRRPSGDAGIEELYGRPFWPDRRPPDPRPGTGTREEFFRALVEHTLDVVLVLDAGLIVRFVSPSVTTLLGYEPIELVGTHGFDHVHPEDASRLLMVFGPSLEVPDASATFAYRIRHREGHWVHMEGVASNHLHDAAVGGIILNARDVTARLRMEEAVTESERRLRGLIEHSLDGIAVVDADGYNVFNSDALGRIMGYPADELAGRSAFELIHPADLKLAEGVFARMLAEPGQPIACSLRVQHRSGGWRDLSLVGVNRLADSAVQGIVVHFRDVTEQRRLERELAVQQQRLEAFFEAAPIGLVILDDQYRYVQINRRLARMHGASPETHVGRSVTEVLPEIAHLIIPVLDQVRETGKAVHQVEWRAGRAENVGHLRRIRGSFFPIDGEEGHRHIAGILADITEQREAEDALRESEARYRRIVETTSEGVWVLDAQNRTEYVNRQLAQMFGYEPDDMIGRSVFEFIDPSYQAQAAESLGRRRR